MGIPQVLYAVIAMMIASLLAFNVQRGTMSAQQRVISNEVLTQFSGVGDEILEDIGSLPFDERTDVTRNPTRLASASELKAPAYFGGNCNPDADYADCLDIDDFHGKSRTLEREGLAYDAAIEVRYVDEDDPTIAIQSQTFAKEGVLHITSPLILDSQSSEPLSIVMTRVFTYQRMPQSL